MSDSPDPVDASRMPWWGYLLVPFAPVVILIGALAGAVAIIAAHLTHIVCAVLGWYTPDWAEERL